MAIKSNNCLFYYQNLVTIGSTNNVQGAIGIVQKYNLLIVKPHVGADLTKLIEIIEACKRINSGFLVYGYTSLGDQTLVSDWEGDVDQWVTDLGDLLDGIFIDNFGFDQTLATRTNQNAAVTYVHSLTVPRPVLVSCSNVVNSLELYTGDPDALLGSSSTIKDGILLDGFYFTNALTDPPTLEDKKSVQGRLKYLKAARSTKNIFGVLNSSTGIDTELTQAEYSNILYLTNQNFIEYLSVSTADKSTSTTSFFFTNKANVFNLF